MNVCLDFDEETQKLASTTQKKMSPKEKEKLKTTKKRLSLKKKSKPNPPTILKVKIPNPKYKVARANGSPKNCIAEAEPIKNCNMRNLKTEHSINLANAVASMQLSKNKVNLVNNAMVAIEEDLEKNKPKKRKKSATTVDSSMENLAKKRKKPPIQQKTPKRSKVAKTKVIKQEATLTAPTKKTTDETPTPVEKKKRGRKKKIQPIGKLDTEPNKLYNEELFNQLQNFDQSSPLKATTDGNQSGDKKVDAKSDLDVKNESDTNLSSRCTSVDDFSWIGNISSSNNTPCNTPNEVVMINGKLPILKLVDCRDIIEAEPISRRESVDSRVSIEKSHESGDTISISKSLSLSSSSTDSDKLSMRLGRELENLRQKLNSLDLEFINWLGNDTFAADLPNVSFDLLKYERESIEQCQKFRQRRMSEVTSATVSEKSKTPEESPSRELTAVETVVAVANDEGTFNGYFRTGEDQIEEDKIKETDVEITAEDNETNANCDDDAISLFTESLLGLEACRRSSIASEAPSYRPKFYNFKKNYEDDKTSEICEKVPKSVCEKQNADSTVCREDKTVTYKGLISSSHSAVAPMGSVVFRGVCFYNMISICKKHHCWFAHRELKPAEISARLCFLTEHVLIAEYMLLRKYPPLREKYMVLFAAEFSRRNLTRVLVEMVLDSVQVLPQVKTAVLETVLENLNQTGLESCKDLMTYKSYITTKLICEVLLKALADTQNFGRFKNVFVSLVEVLTKLGRKFDLEEAGKLLVRIFILPFEEPLTKALIQVIKNTDQAIFENAFIANFEERLASSSAELHEDYLQYKRSVVREAAPAPTKPDDDQGAEKKRYTSPDTTHLERLKIDGPIITRTIDTSTNKRTTIRTPTLAASTPTPLMQTPIFKPNFKVRSQHQPLRGPMRGQLRPISGPIRPYDQDWQQSSMNFRSMIRRPYNRVSRGGSVCD